MGKTTTSYGLTVDFSRCAWELRDRMHDRGVQTILLTNLVCEAGLCDSGTYFSDCYKLAKTLGRKLTRFMDDLLAAMARDTGVPLTALSADGGASRDGFLMQFQADISACAIRRPAIRETTALGACYLAGLAAGVWKNRDELRRLWRCDAVFRPEMDADTRARLRRGWAKAVGRSLDWAEHG